jgi:hypothetical protein
MHPVRSIPRRWRGRFASTRRQAVHPRDAILHLSPVVPLNGTSFEVYLSTDCVCHSFQPPTGANPVPGAGAPFAGKVDGDLRTRPCPKLPHQPAPQLPRPFADQERDNFLRVRYEFRALSPMAVGRVREQDAARISAAPPFKRREGVVKVQYLCTFRGRRQLTGHWVKVRGLSLSQDGCTKCARRTQQSSPAKTQIPDLAWAQTFQLNPGSESRIHCAGRNPLPSVSIQ